MIDHNELLPEGKELGGFRIESQLGNGNMGIIYRAIQINLNRPVALKVLFRSVAADQDFVRSFFREAQAAAAFTHQNIVQAFDVGQSEEGIYYFAMELIEGGDIDDKLKDEGTYTAVEAVELMVGIADGLDYGSSLRKLTHGDIKPANIMLTKTQNPKLADLGLARMGGEIQGESDGIMLTPLYAAPEMIQGQWEVGDPRADMYSVGATLYHMITGEPPFNDPDYRKVIDMQVNNEHTRLHDWDPAVPVSISKLIDKLLEKDPDDRYQTWEDAKKAMEVSLKKANDPVSHKKKKVLHYHKSEETHSSRKKKSSMIPIVVIVLILVGGGFFVMNMKKGVSTQEFTTLKASFKNDSNKSVVLKLESFIKKYGDSAPLEAKNLLKEYQSKVSNRSLFDSGDLSKQTELLSRYENFIQRNNKNFIHQFTQNSASFENKLGKGLDNRKLNLHFPLDNSPQNFADFHTLTTISTKGDVSYTVGRVGNAVQFDGSSFNYGDTPRSRFSHSGTFSIGLWLKPEKTTFPILGKCEVSGGQLNKGYLLSLNQGKVNFALYGNSAENAMDVLTKDLIKENEWLHILVQYENKQVKIFLNGKESELDVKSTLTENFASTGPLVIGFKHFKGLLDDVRIWSRTLTSAEVQELVEFRGESDIEKMVKRYRQLQIDADGQKSIISEAPTEEPQEDTKKYTSELGRALLSLMNNFDEWDSYAKKVQEVARKEYDENPDKRYLRFLIKNTHETKKSLIKIIRDKSNFDKIKHKILSGKFIDHSVHKVSDSSFSLLKRAPYGDVECIYYYDEARSQEALTSLIAISLAENDQLFRKNPFAALGAIIISKGKLTGKIKNSLADDKASFLINNLFEVLK
ncbi:MAG: protein kinase [Lentisphaeraceae bacterium]|nr:protein kinase [Lentisphaeraceae bacterium]